MLTTNSEQGFRMMIPTAKNSSASIIVKVGTRVSFSDELHGGTKQSIFIWAQSPHLATGHRESHDNTSNKTITNNNNDDDKTTTRQQQQSEIIRVRQSTTWHCTECARIVTAQSRWLEVVLSRWCRLQTVLASFRLHSIWILVCHFELNISFLHRIENNCLARLFHHKCRLLTRMRTSKQEEWAKGLNSRNLRLQCYSAMTMAGNLFRTNVKIGEDSLTGESCRWEMQSTTRRKRCGDFRSTRIRWA